MLLLTPVLAGAVLSLLLLQKFFGGDTGVLENGAQRALWHGAWMIGDGGVAVSYGVEPDLVGTASLAVELQAKVLFGRLTMSRQWKPASLPTSLWVFLLLAYATR